MFTPEEGGWIVYGVKIGLVDAVLWGFGIGLYFTDASDRLQQLFGLICMGCGFILLVGAFAMMRGIKPGGLKRLRFEEVEEVPVVERD